MTKETCCIVDHQKMKSMHNAGLLPSKFNQPLYALWEITYACPLKCIHCYNHSGEAPLKHKSVEETVKIAHQLGESGVFGVCLSGGEPSMHPAFFEVARILRHEYKVNVGTPTNGYNITANKAEKMLDLFSLIQVSVDGADAATHDYIRAVKGSFNQAINTVSLLNDLLESRTEESSPMLAIALAANSLNYHQVENLVDRVFSEYPNLKEVRVQPQVPSGRGVESDLLLSLDQQQEVEDKAAQLTKKWGKLVRYENPMVHIWKALEGWPWETMVIDPYGKVRFSPWLPGNVGSLDEESLDSIWENKLSTIHKDPDFIQVLSRLHSVNDAGKAYHSLESIFGTFGGKRPVHA
ncbi:MAG: radical SAM protein [Corynebacterium sp.]|nr:radical SAM protein [Corynebacterium sp.]